MNTITTAPTRTTLREALTAAFHASIYADESKLAAMRKRIAENGYAIEFSTPRVNVSRITCRYRAEARFDEFNEWHRTTLRMRETRHDQFILLQAELAILGCHITKIERAK